MKPTDYNLGYMIGEFIVWQYLPTLSNHPCQSCHVIDVSPDEMIEFNRLTDIWLGFRHKSGERDIAWEQLKIYEKYLDMNYLPETVECNLPITLSNKTEDIEQGIFQSLWDSDCSCYDATEFAAMTITLKRRD